MTAERVCRLHNGDAQHTTADAVGVVTGRGSIVPAHRGCAVADVEPDLIVDVERCTDLWMARS